jgi:hypothetical protein
MPQWSGYDWRVGSTKPAPPLSRHVAQKSKLRLLCKAHGVQAVLDLFQVNGGTVKLECGCRRRL